MTCGGRTNMTLTEKKKEASIRKWIGISHGTTKDYHGANCTLCKEFHNEENEDCENNDGDECPIVIVSGEVGCYGTPYSVWRRHQIDKHKSNGGIELYRKATCQECKVLALYEMHYVYNAIDTYLGWE
jgi:hypothetical protein